MTDLTRCLESYKGKYILIVEQGDLLPTPVQQELTRLGAVIVGPTASVDHALAIIDQLRVDAVILDVELDAAAAYALSEHLSRLNIPLVFASGEPVDPAPEGLFRGFTLTDSSIRLSEISEALFQRA